MKKIWKFFCVFCFCGFFVSCATMSGFKNPVKSGVFYGMIVDDRNQPVKNYRILCKDGRQEVKSAVTNDSGMFLLDEILTGTVEISGEGKNYSLLKNEKVDFTGSQKVYCWQINSTEGILELVEESVLRGNYREAADLLDKINYENDWKESIQLKQLSRKLKKKAKLQESEKND